MNGSEKYSDGDTATSAAPVRNDEVEPIFSLVPLSNTVAYAARATRRHPILAVASALFTVLLLGLLLLSSPPAYSSTVSLLVRDDSMFRQIVSPQAGDRTDLLTNGITATIESRASLDGIIDRAGLMQSDVQLPMFGRVKDAISEAAFGAESDQAKLERLRAELKAAIAVVVSGDQNTIEIAVLWPDPEQALAIAQQAQQSFLDTQSDIEIGSLEEAVQILQDEVTSANDDVSALRQSLDLGPDDDVPVGSALELAVAQQRQAQDQLTSGRLLLETEKASFRHRYTEIDPAELATEPLGSQLIPQILTLILTAVLTALCCVARETLSGRVWEPRQVERKGVPMVVHLTERF